MLGASVLKCTHTNKGNCEIPGDRIYRFITWSITDWSTVIFLITTCKSFPRPVYRHSEHWFVHLGIFSFIEYIYWNFLTLKYSRLCWIGEWSHSKDLDIAMFLYNSQFGRKNKEILSSASNSAGRNDVACSHWPSYIFISILFQRYQK